ncbi:hypothetical protein DMB95_00130 [Campylobacter sp. MIT 12-8780]|uniref:hypothetical protein n=1 Tax=unclassified Campylobacter TaxID=2593542 RepID=UPI00115DBD2B|nr:MULTISPECIES: hypothetical protein [unclassified Campylobacter]NDJ26366.1 hypothetical protein [Campylobacter sp. MIT 19-121]TQR42943.1 hypothetical protein DMB95_00130 [Campylobacter sp. MIT 12-8780]
MLLKNFIGSFVCVSALCSQCWALDTENFITAVIKDEKNIKTSAQKTKQISIQEYEIISSKVFQMLSLQFFSMVSLKEPINQKDKQGIKAYIKKLDEVQKVAQKRLSSKQSENEGFKTSTLKVYYGAVALKNTLEIMIDEHLFEQIGFLDENIIFSSDFDLAEYAKGILAAQESLKACNV